MLNFVSFIFFKCVMVTFCNDTILDSFHSDIRFQIWLPNSCDGHLLIASSNSRSCESLYMSESCCHLLVARKIQMLDD